MLRVALRALRSRRTQSVTLVLLAALVAAAAVAAPFYVYASSDHLAVHDTQAAPNLQRTVTIAQSISIEFLSKPALDVDMTAIEAQLTLPYASDVTGITSIRVPGSIGGGINRSQTSLAFRTGVCAEVAVTGRCPSATGEVMLSAGTATILGLRVGDTTAFAAESTNRPLPLHIVGVYRPLRPDDPYWGASMLAAQSKLETSTGLPTVDALFGTETTVLTTKSSGGEIDRDLVIGVHSVTARNALRIGNAVTDAAPALLPKGYVVTSDMATLTNQIIFDSNLIFVGVPLGTAELVVFGWFALFLAIRATAAARRFDVGVLKLRGIPRRGLWTLMVEQSAVPVLVGTPFGMVAGYLGARFLAGSITDHSDLRAALVLAAAATAAAILGGLLAALIAERGALGTPVAELLRSTPARRRGWRTDVIDLILVVVAIAGIVQLRNTAGRTGSGLAILAPGLVALAAGLLIARMLSPLAGRAIALTRRAGRVRGLLVATYLSRRPGLDRVFALVAIAVTLFGYSILAWTTAAQARTDRATVEVGPTRVVTVQTVPPDRLLRAVRAADPTGRYAMAATQISGNANSAGVIAVDSSRLAAVLPDGSGSGRSGADLAALLHPTTVTPVSVTGTSLQLNLDVTKRVGASAVFAVLTGSDGLLVLANFGRLRASEHVYTAATPTCVTGCALIGFALSDGTVVGHSASPAPPGSAVLLRELRQQAPDQSVLTAADFTNRTRWRTTFDPSVVGPVIGASAAGLTLSVPTEGINSAVLFDPVAYVVTGPVPPPVVRAVGALPDPQTPGLITVSPFGLGAMPVRIAGTEAVLPRLEASGVLIDIDYAQALSTSDSGTEASQVWLASDAPASVLRALDANGLVRTGEQTVAQVDRGYGQQASVIALRFQVLGGVIGIALAALALLIVAAVERDPRARELVALRHQGVSRRATRGVATRGYGWLAGAALIAGLLTAVLDRWITANHRSLFSDGWSVLPRPPLVTVFGVSLALVIAGGTLAVATALAAYQLIRTVRMRSQEASR